MTTKNADRTKELLAELEAGLSELVSGDDWARAMETNARFHNYSFYNTLAIIMQRPDATRVAGFKTWQSLGRCVRKGEKGIAILAPRKIRVEDETTKETLGYKLIGFRTVYVFDIAQTDGDELPTCAPVPLDGDAPAGMLESVVAMIEDAGCRFELAPVPGSANGYYSPTENKIVVDSGLSGLQQIKTAIHELAHLLSEHGKGSDDTREIAEVVVESVAFIVGKALGLDSSGYSFPYVASWSGGDLSKIKSVGERVCKLSRQILQGIETDATEAEEAVA